MNRLTIPIDIGKCPNIITKTAVYKLENKHVLCEMHANNSEIQNVKYS